MHFYGTRTNLMLWFAISFCDCIPWSAGTVQMTCMSLTSLAVNGLSHSGAAPCSTASPSWSAMGEMSRLLFLLLFVIGFCVEWLCLPRPPQQNLYVGFVLLPTQKICFSVMYEEARRKQENCFSCQVLVGFVLYTMHTWCSKYFSSVLHTLSTRPGYLFLCVRYRYV